MDGLNRDDEHDADAPTRPLEDHDPAAARVDRAAADYVAARAGGEAVDAEAFGAELQSDDEREAFRQRIEEVDRLSALFPRQVCEGRVLCDRYRVVRELGSGGMGKVFEAVDTHLDRRVALKVLTAIDVRGVDLLDLFRRESRVQAALRHPGIVPIHEASRDGDVYFLVMDLVDGVSCDRVIKNAKEARAASKDGRPPTLREAVGLPFPDGGVSLYDDRSWVRSALRVMIDVTRAIEAAHAQGVMHRDLKPGNVMITGDGRPVVLDFGLAKRLGEDQGALTRGLFGTPSYLAPEQATQGAVGDDPRSDVYALGLLLYELLTLRPAFPGDEISPVLTNIVDGNFVPPRRLDKSIPVDVETVCLRAMELDPARRYQTATQLREDLEACLEGDRPPRVFEGTRLGRALRDARYFARRHKAGLALAAAMATGVTLGVAMFGGGRGAAGVETSWIEALAVRPDESKVRLARDEIVDLPVGTEVTVMVTTEQPVWLYALLISGDEDEPDSYVTVLEATPLDEFEDVPDDQYGVEVPSGTNGVWLRTVEREEGVTRERVEVVCANERQPAVERWLRDIDVRAQDTPMRRIVYSGAFNLATAPTGIRGGKPPQAGADVAERERTAARLRGLLRSEAESDWGRRYSIRLNVVD